MFKEHPQGKAGFLDPDGRTIIEPAFKNALPFRNGLARVEDDKEWAYINKQGTKVWSIG